ncbi:MAG TPA: protein kinase, partial [Pirellulales bacterium]|nr:protein kinase [Pirellulales bacterium]
MSLTLDRFWNLLAESRLIQQAELGQLSEAAASAEGTGAPSPDKIARWLVGKSKLSNYQAKILLSGRAGPFFYGDYQIYDRIESGRLSGIFRALHMPTRHPVCLYFLSGAMMQDAQTIAQLAQQAYATNRMTAGHPNLFRCYHLADQGAFKFIVIEDLKGRRVERLLATSGGALKADEACRIARQAALGLARLHAMGHAHGEIRPANIWLDAHEQAKLLLFPLYRDPLTLPSAWLAEIRAGNDSFKGKLPNEAEYIAPELISGKSPPDARSDIYSLGCTLYHMLAYRAPFAGSNLKVKLRQHLKEEPQPLTSVNPAVPPGLSKLVGYMMAKDPDLRYQKAESVVEGLLAHLSPEAAQTQPVPPTRRSQAYEQWLVTNAVAPPAPSVPGLAPSPTKTATAASAEPVVAPAAAFEAPVAQAVPVAQAAPFAQATSPGWGGPVMTQPVAASPAAPVMASAAPMMATPVMGGVAVAAPIMGIPTAGVPVAAAAVAIPSAGAVVPSAAVVANGMAMAVPTFGSPMGEAAPMAAPFGASMSASDSGPIRSTRGRSAKKSNRTLMFVAVGFIVVTAVAVAGLHFGGVVDLHELMASLTAEESGTQRTTASQPTTASVVETAPIAETPEVKAEPIVGLADGIWSSPTSGPAIELKYMALGMQAVAVLRPADILKHPDGKNLLAPDMSPAIEALAAQHPLGVLGHWVQHTLPGLCGSPLEKIQQVFIGWPESGGDTGTIAVVARLSEPADEAALLQTWGNPSPVEAEGEKYFTAAGTGYFLPKAENGHVVVIAPAEEVKEAVGGSMVLWATPEPEKLLQSSDADRHFTFVMPTRFLSSGGKAALEGRGARLKGGVDWLLGNDAGDAVKAVMLSAHLTDRTFFAEARLFNPLADVQTLGPADVIAERVREIPRSVKIFKDKLLKTAFSEQLLLDFDDRVKLWAGETRFGTADKQVVVRSYLPAPAALYLSLGTHLCLLENVMGAGMI